MQISSKNLHLLCINYKLVNTGKFLSKDVGLQLLCEGPLQALHFLSWPESAWSTDLSAKFMHRPVFNLVKHAVGFTHYLRLRPVESEHRAFGLQLICLVDLKYRWR